MSGLGPGLKMAWPWPWSWPLTYLPENNLGLHGSIEGIKLITSGHLSQLKNAFYWKLQPLFKTEALLTHVSSLLRCPRGNEKVLSQYVLLAVVTSGWTCL